VAHVLERDGKCAAFLVGRTRGGVVNISPDAWLQLQLRCAWWPWLVRKIEHYDLSGNVTSDYVDGIWFEIGM
jgi:hypothetical protein